MLSIRDNAFQRMLHCFSGTGHSASAMRLDIQVTFGSFRCESPVPFRGAGCCYTTERPSKVVSEASEVVACRNSTRVKFEKLPCAVHYVNSSLSYRENPDEAPVVPSLGVMGDFKRLCQKMLNKKEMLPTPEYEGPVQKRVSDSRCPPVHTCLL